MSEGCGVWTERDSKYIEEIFPKNGYSREMKSQLFVPPTYWLLKNCIQNVGRTILLNSAFWRRPSEYANWLPTCLVNQQTTNTNYCRKRKELRIILNGRNVDLEAFLKKTRDADFGSLYKNVRWVSHWWWSRIYLISPFNEMS